MARKTKITDFKTTRINQFTGGTIKDYQIPDYPKDSFSDGLLSNSFISPDGTYMGDYGQGWWYFRKNLVVCRDYPHGTAVRLKNPANKCSPEVLADIKAGNVDSHDIDGYYGFSHRGGCLFKIGDKLFDEGYEPVEKDYTPEQWQKFLKEQQESIEEKKTEYKMDEDHAISDSPISDYISFRMRGAKTIESWNEAKQAAINLSKSLG